MTKTIKFLLSVIVLVMLPFLVGASVFGAQENEQEHIVDFLFVQNAKNAVFENGTLTLEGVSPTTLYFSDRPDRIVGHMATEELLDLWTEGEKSFADEPPNATLSIFDEKDGSALDIVVVLSNPRLQEDNFSYDVQILDGNAPESGGVSTLFIDRFGRPLTPVSVAGVARRTTRRTVRRHAVYGPHPYVRPAAVIGTSLIVGATLATLPVGYREVHVGPTPYYYANGAFYDYNSTKNVYVVVNAPAGAEVSLLPSGYATVPVGGTNYYYAQGVFYSYNPGPRDYVVVNPPMGAVVPSIPEGYKTVNLNGVEYYDFNGVYYQPVQQGNATVYQVAGGE